MDNRIKDPQIFISVDCDKVLSNVKDSSEFKRVVMANKDLFLLAVLFGCLKGSEIGKKQLTNCIGSAEIGQIAFPVK